MDSLARSETYRRLYKTRPSQLGLAMQALIVVLAPALVLLALTRLVMFLLITTCYVLLPSKHKGLLFKSERFYRGLLFLATGIFLRGDTGRAVPGVGRRLIVMNHHGAIDAALMPILWNMKIDKLVVSDTTRFYERASRWVFFFHHDLEILSTGSVQSLMEGSKSGTTLVFAEGAGKKAPVVFSFRPEIFRLFNMVCPYAASCRFALPLFNAYGVDLPFHKTMSYLLLTLTPFTVMTIRQLPLIVYPPERYREAARSARDAIAKAAGYEALDFMFSQSAFDACVMSKPRHAVAASGGKDPASLPNRGKP